MSDLLARVTSALADRYRIERELGQGGMATVYLAEDLKHHRLVAIKVLKSELSAVIGPERFLREIETAARLNHPHILPLHDSGEAGGFLYYVMPYMAGESLRARLARETQLPVDDALQITREVADALGYAHGHGVVHRDIKPENILLESGHAVVADFGIARAITAAAGETLTGAGMVLGTPAYMSPEQAAGAPDVDGRADLYALGCVLYEMLAGQPPFTGSTAASLAYQHLSVAPRPVTELRPTVPGWVAVALQRALAKVPADRFSPVTLFAEALAHRQASPALVIPSIPSPQPARRWRRFVLLGAAATVVAAGTLGIWKFPAWFNQPALAFNERDWIVVADVQNLTGDPVFDRSLSTALAVGLSQSQYVNVLPQGRVRDVLQRMQRTTADGLDETLASELAVREGAKAVVACSIAQVGNVYSLTAQLIDPQSRMPVLTESVRVEGKDEVLPALDRLGSQMRRKLGESLGALSRQHVPLSLATTASVDALKLYTDARHAPDPIVARQLLEEALKLDANFAMALAQMGASYYRESDQASRLKGEQHLTKALSLVDRLSFRERLLITALAEDSRGNRNGAVVAYKACLEAYPDDLDTWFRLGWTYMAALRHFEPAVEAFRRVIAMDPDNAAAFVNLATSLSGLGRYTEAREAYERAFALQPLQMMGTFVNHEYGFTLVRLGDLDRAAEVFQKMAADSDDSKRAKGCRSLALLEMYRGHYKNAAELFGRAIRIEQLVAYNVSEFRDRVFLANNLQARGQRRALEAELGRIETLALRMDLAPEWLRVAVKLLARNGRPRQARALVAAMEKNVGNPTSDSSANRNTQRDAALLEVARGEIDLAAGRPDQAAGRFAAACESDATDSDALESLATARLAAGRIDEAARHYEKLIADRRLGNEVQEYWFLAHLRLAEIRQRQGNPAAARTLYEIVLSLWKDGDADLLALREAREGLAGLN